MVARTVLFLALVHFSLLTAANALAQPEPIAQWGTAGSGDGEFSGPTRVAADPYGGPVWVCDTGNHRVQKFDSDGNFQMVLGSQGSGPGQFESPSGVGTDGFGNVYVADTGNHRIQKFDALGQFLTQWGGQGTGDGFFESPQGVAAVPFSGEVYVADTGNHRVQVFSATGVHQLTLGSFGTVPGHFVSPEDVAAYFDEVFVVDTGNDRVQKVAGFLPGLVFGSSGSGAGQFSGPRGIGVDCDGSVLVADTGNHRVQRFDTAGGFIEELGGFGSAIGQFDGPVDVSGAVSLAVPRMDTPAEARPEASADSKIIQTPDWYVVDTGNSRVQSFDVYCLCGGIIGIPDPGRSYATTPGGSLFIKPDGAGPTLASIGSVVEVYVLDPCEAGIPGYPFQDIWLGHAGGADVSLCQGGSVADGNTNVDGFTTISGAIAGGGSTQVGMQVYLAGVQIPSPTLPILVNSPDADGDLDVDLADVGLFAAWFFNGSYDFAGDFTHDGTENLADVAVLANAMGATCP